MSIRGIPVFLKPGDETPVGYASIVEDQMIIAIRNERLTDSIERLASVGDIKELYLGVGFMASNIEAISPDIAQEMDVSAESIRRALEVIRRALGIEP